MYHTECKDCKLREGDCGYHLACDQYGNCMFFRPKPNTNEVRLIDANALREQIEDCKYFESSFQKMTVAEFLTIVHELFDNAPTIPQTIITEFKGCDNCELERPQGEWVKVKENRMSIDMSGEIVTSYKCSKCGRLILTIPSNLVDYPFCHCGADMRKEKTDGES